MASPLVESLLGEASWMDRPSQALQNFWHGVFRLLGPLGRPLKDLLHGTPLGHPLHALLTDLPIGMWTAVVLLDLVHLIWGASFGRATDFALWGGVVAALAAAVSGYTDWSETYGLERRTGLTHGVLMLVTTILFIISGLVRIPGESGGAAVVGIIGYVFLLAAAYFGGEMPYGFATEVNRNAVIPWPEDFVAVARASDVPEGKTMLGKGADLRILLFRQGNDITAINAVCAHAGGPLDMGEVRDGIVTCPWHGSRYRVRDGAVKGGPATFPQTRFEVRVRDGMVEVKPR